MSTRGDGTSAGQPREAGAHGDVTADPGPPGDAPLPLGTPAGMAAVGGNGLTLRALLTGAVLGALFSACNVYVGLKIGSTVGTSIAAALLGFGFWKGFGRISPRAAGWGVLENNINQTACSAAAAVAAAGLVAPLPALTLLTGKTLTWPWMALWVLSVMLVGISVAIPLRRVMIEDEKLAFAPGVATAEMLRDLHRRGREAGRRLLALLLAVVAAGGIKVAAALKLVRPCPLPGAIGGYALGGLGFAIIPMPLLVGVGGLIGLRVCGSLLAGAVVAYGVVAPRAIHAGLIASPPSFGAMNRWLLWPGVTLMVVGALMSALFSWRSIGRAFRDAYSVGTTAVAGGRRARLVLAFGGVLLLSVLLQRGLFGIAVWVAVLAVLLTFALAMVAGRVSGETGIGAVGPMGKVAQLAFGLLRPHSPIPNLMAANVAGGAASQCADLLNDFKCGQELGASPRSQTLAQVVGAVVGAAAGAVAYLVLVPDAHALQTMAAGTEWPMPAVKSWKAVAELFVGGFDELPAGTRAAMTIAACVAVALVMGERLLPARWRRAVPSATGVGLAFVLPASVSLVIFVGGAAAAVAGWIAPRWRERYWVALCAGVITGESLVGIGLAVAKLLQGGS